MSALEVLHKTRKLISRPETWTQNAWARSTDGHRCASGDPWAAAWCAAGALGRAAGFDMASYNAAYEYLRAAAPFTSMVDWNDGNGHADVLAAFDKAISELERRANKP